jgi:uncharacterized membrane protein YkvA (DUF1232 family)
MEDKGGWARKFEVWSAALPTDVQTMWELMNNETVAPQGRRFVAGALSYLLTQLDIIPDHEKAGSVDDAFVVRVCFGLLAEHATQVHGDSAAQIGRLTNEEDQVREFLGAPMHDKLRRYVLEFAEKTVRGRSPDQILTDARARSDMKRELDLKMKTHKPLQHGSDEEAQQVEVTVKSYFKMKLGG